MQTFEIRPEVGEEFRANGGWTDERLLDFARRAVDDHPEELLAVDESGKLTWAEGWEAALRLASTLRSLGVERGSVVSVQLPNWREYAVIQLATDLLGAVLNPMLTLFRENEVKHILTVSESVVLIVPEQHRAFDGFVAMGARLLEDVPSLERLIVVRPTSDDLPQAAMSWDQALKADPIKVDSIADFHGDDPTVVCFTSGTEALAKGCVHSHNTALYFLRNVRNELALDGDLPVYMPSPLGASLGIMCGLRMALFLGSTIVLQDKWDPRVAAEMISKNRCQFTVASTPFVQQLVDHVRESDEGYDLTAFRYFVSGGAPIPRELVRQAQGVIGAELLPVYGQSECYAVTLVRPDDPDEVKFSCDGWPLPLLEVRVVDEEGNDVGPGEEGELLVRGPNVMLGYLNPPEGSRPTGPGDWLHTGDYVRMDANQNTSIVGRKKEIIIRGGVNISPREIEDALLGHDKVKAVAVVGYADERLGERVCAVVVPVDDSPTLDELTTYLRETRQFAVYKQPERLEIVDELPVSAIGKTLKVELKKLVERRIADEGRDRERGAVGAGESTR